MLRHDLARMCRVLFAALILLPVLGWPAQVVHESLPAAVSNLTPEGDPDPMANLNLTIGLPARSQVELSVFLQQLYDPASTNYHRYLSPVDFAQRFGPSEADYQALIGFAKAHGLSVSGTHPNRLLLDVSGPVSAVEKALHVKMHVYRHPTEARTFYAPDAEPSLDLSVPVLGIGGLNNYGLPRPRLTARRLSAAAAAKPNAGAGPGSTYMGNDFRAAYLPDTSLTGTGQSVGLLEFDGYTTSDITYYESTAGLPNVPLRNVLLDGFGGSPTGSGGEVEVSLDIEVAISLAPGLSQVIVYEAGPGGSWHDILNQMATDNAATQLSCSWYIPGGGADPVADLIWQEMAAQGQSFLNASGDSDAYTGPISFPGDSPYITQVGGTTLTTSGPGGSWVSEKVWNWNNGVGSSGGVSTHYSIPIWQSGIDMTANLGSTTMRNTPDVAFTADNVYVRADGANYDVGGTSCAAPLWAAFVALCNQQSTSSGGAAMGFLNPAVYSVGVGPNYATVFHDITTGNNQRSGSGADFPAAPGYDLCTGWGTPPGQNLINALAGPLVPTPPTITKQPQGQTIPDAGNVTFSVTAYGSFPLSYQWTLGTTNIAGATASILTLTDVQQSQAGNYTVVVSNAYGMTISSNALLGVLPPVPPTITSQPMNETVTVDGIAAFNVKASGTPPLMYQWYFNGTNVPGATNNGLLLPNVQSNQAGFYAVLVSNIASSTLSSNALLTVVPPPTNLPIIASFSPASGPTGTVVTISGLNFSTSTGGNIVRFGAVEVPVSSANSTNIVVSVPAGATYAPPTVTVGGLTAYARAPFILTFPGGGYIDPTILAPAIDFSTPNGPDGTVIADIDGDGRPDLVVADDYNGTISIFQNLSVPGSIDDTSFGPPIVLPVPPNSGSDNVWTLAVADLDGDGQPDIIAVNLQGNTVSIYQNLCVPGSITTNSFGSRIDLAVGQFPIGVAVGDLDGDGRPDIVTANSNSGTISILQNISTPGLLTSSSFAPQFQLPGNSGPHGVALADIDGDGKADIVVANSSAASDTTSIFRNLSAPGTLSTNSFAPRVDFPGGGEMVAIGDLDGDGKPDLAVGSYQKGVISVFRNASTPGNITTNSLASRVDFTVGGSVHLVAIGDIDGDGKPDIASVSQSGTLTLFKNVSTPGSFTPASLLPPVNFSAGGNLPGVVIGDLDGDGRPDIAFANISGNTLAVCRNVLSPTAPSITSQPTNLTETVGANATFTVGATGSQPLSYQWNFDGTNIAGATSSALILTNLQLAQSGSYSVEVNNAYGSLLSSNAVLAVLAPPSITNQPQNQTVAAGSNATFAVGVAGSAPLSYRWTFNGYAIPGATSSSLVLSNVQFAQSGNYAVKVTNAVGVAFGSNALLTVLSPPVITAQPQGQAVIAGGTANFGVAATGSLPFGYQWSFDGTNLAGATAGFLTLTNIQSAEAGGYSVVVTNAYGSVSSSNALLTVLPLSGGGLYIFGFSPASGPIGTIVNIQGTNFSPVSASNTVYFGAVQAVINAASPTNLEVVVPAGATFSPPSVTVGGFTAAARSPFIVTFSGGGYINSNILAHAINFGTPSGPNGMAMADLDGDGKPDLVIANDYNGTLSIYRNTSSPGSITNTSFASPLVLPVPPNAGGDSVWTVAVADLDGDGRLDVVAVNLGGNTVSIYQNLSSPGSLTTNSFGARIDLPVGSFPIGLAIGDLDGDGRPDIITANYNSQTISILQNVSAPGLLTSNSFASQIQLAANSGPHGVAIADMDGDGKVDIVVANSSGASDTTSIFRNVGSPGALGTNSFAARVDFAGGGEMVAIGDLDGDGKPDLALASYQKGVMSVFRNTSTPGSITTNSLAGRVDFSASGNPHTVAIGDVDGDGKPDLTLVVYGSHVSFFKNVSTPGSFTASSLQPRVDYASGDNPAGVAIGDLDGDGRPDIAFVNIFDNTLSVCRNLLSPLPIITRQPTNIAVLAGSNATFTVAASGGMPLGEQWFFNGMNPLAGATQPTLTLTNVQPSQAGYYSVLVTNAYGSALSFNALLTVLTAPSVHDQPLSQWALPGCSVSFFVTAKGTVPLGYQWWNSMTPLPGQTNSTLTLPDVQASDFTNYYAIVSNAYGAATSSVATLSLEQPPVAGAASIQRYPQGGLRVSAAQLLANDLEYDGYGLSVISVSSNTQAGGSATLTNGEIFYLPPMRPTNFDSFSYTISDGQCGGIAVGGVSVVTKPDSLVPLNLAIQSQSSGSFQLAFDGVPGFTYQIQYTDNLLGTNWQVLADVIADQYGVCQYSDPVTNSAPVRFYRTQSSLGTLGK